MDSSLDAHYIGAKITFVNSTTKKIAEYAQKANLAGRESDVYSLIICCFCELKDISVCRNVITCILV